jgi:hypothetical protein
MARVAPLALLAAVMAACALPCDAAATPIYRCVAGGAVTYTDTPCKGGEAIDVHAGSASPAAIERLAREQQLASERYARQRIAEQEMERMRPPPEVRVVEPLPPPPDSYGYCTYCGGWVDFVPPKPPRVEPRPTRRSSSFVPAAPRVPGR